MRIEFNTGRYYSPEGQLIKAILIDNKIYFKDMSRQVEGVLFGRFETVTPFIVLANYDRGYYHDHKYPE